MAYFFSHFGISLEARNVSFYDKEQEKRNQVAFLRVFAGFVCVVALHFCLRGPDAFSGIPWFPTMFYGVALLPKHL